MARQRRHDLSQPLLHVYSRGADRQDIFSSDGDRALFEHLMADAVDLHGLVLHAYAFMNNHVHLLIDRANGDVSAAMQFLLGRYALAYNARTERSGPLFGGRFGCTEISTSEQFLQCSRYVHRNPLEFVPHGALVAYRWSSLPVYAGRRPGPDWLATGTVPGLFHTSSEAYVDYVMRPQPGDDDRGIPLRPWEALTLAVVDEVVVDITGESPATSHWRGRKPATARALAVGAAVELRLTDTRSMADHYGMSSPASVRNTARRSRIRRTEDPGFDMLYRRVLTRLRRLAAANRLPRLDDTLGV